MAIENQQSILKYWFGSKIDDLEVARDRTALWWSKNDSTDEEIRERFLETLETAASGELDSWKETPEGLLALIILMDQFSRNIFRGTAQSFQYDEAAKLLSRQAPSPHHA